MQKPRTRPRKNTPNHVKVLDHESGQVLGRVVDITADGLMLVTAACIDPGRHFHIRIVLPRMTDGKLDISVKTETIWCQQDKNPSFFKVGLRFINLSGKDGFILEDVMHKMNLVG